MTAISEAPLSATQQNTLAGLGPTGQNLSIMIPNYNGAKYIAETLESLKLQGDSIRDSQIMVIDNCSTDSSEEVTRAIWGDRVYFHRNEKNLGMIGNFNACVAHAQGSWIHILHSDDVLLYRAYENFNDCIQQFPDSAIVFGQNMEIDEEGNWTHSGSLIGSSERGVLEYDPSMWRMNFAQFVGTIFRKEAALTVGEFDEELPHCSDWNYWWRIARCLPAAYINTPVGLYRRFTENATAKNMRTGLTITDPLKQIEKLVDCPKSAELLNRTGRDFFYQPMFAFALWQCSLFFGNPESFSANMNAMRKFPRSLFTSHKEMSLRLQHLRYRFAVKRRFKSFLQR